MAGEIKLDLRLRAVKSSVSIDQDSKAIQVVADMAGDAFGRDVQSIPTTAGGTAISIPAAVGTAGQALFKNNDASNYVEIGVQVGGTFYPAVKLLAGEACAFRVGGTLYALANTAAVKLEKFILEL